LLRGFGVVVVHIDYRTSTAPGRIPPRTGPADVLIHAEHDPDLGFPPMIALLHCGILAVPAGRGPIDPLWR
jgi:hypothetical protein